jgi:AhpC/TSA family
VRRIANKGVFVLVFWMSLALAQDQLQDKPATPAEKYQALLRELQNEPEDLSGARTAQERQQVQARRATLPRRFLELAEAYPTDPVALEALIQSVSLVNSTAFPEGGKDSPGERALALLLRDHVRSDKLGAACQQILFGFHKSRETFLRAVLETNPHRQVQGLACLSLAQCLSDRLNRLGVLEDQDQSDLTERYERVFGKAFLEELQRQDRAATAREVESLFVRAANDYSDVEIPVTYFGSGGTVGEKAEAELFQIRHLAVGKEAPEIEGEDQDGKPFKLTDYRGKVVLLDFWHRT